MICCVRLRLRGCSLVCLFGSVCVCVVLCVCDCCEFLLRFRVCSFAFLCLHALCVFVCHVAFMSLCVYYLCRCVRACVAVCCVPL